MQIRVLRSYQGETLSKVLFQQSSPPLLTLFKTFPPNFILPRQKKLFSLIQRIPEKNNDLIFKMGGNDFLKILTPLSTHL